MKRPLLSVNPHHVAAHCRVIGRARVMSKRDALVFHALKQKV